MTFAEGLRPILANARGIGGNLGLRPHSVSILTVDESANTHTGDGSETTSETALLEDGQNPKVRWLSDEQRALAQDTTGAEVTVGPLSPDHQIGGVTIAELSGTALATGDRLYLLITGPKHPSGKRYAIKKITAHSALRYMVDCTPA